MQLIPLPNPLRVDQCAPIRVDKGWGHELWIVNQDYCGKLLHFRKGKKCSWHSHLFAFSSHPEEEDSIRLVRGD